MRLKLALKEKIATEGLAARWPTMMGLPNSGGCDGGAAVYRKLLDRLHQPGSSAAYLDNNSDVEDDADQDASGDSVCAGAVRGADADASDDEHDHGARVGAARDAERVSSGANDLADLMATPPDFAPAPLPLGARGGLVVNVGMYVHAFQKVCKAHIAQAITLEPAALRVLQLAQEHARVWDENHKPHGVAAPSHIACVSSKYMRQSGRVVRRAGVKAFDVLVESALEQWARDAPPTARYPGTTVPPEFAGMMSDILADGEIGGVALEDFTVRYKDTIVALRGDTDLIAMSIAHGACTRPFARSLSVSSSVISLRCSLPCVRSDRARLPSRSMSDNCETPASRCPILSARVNSAMQRSARSRPPPPRRPAALPRATAAAAPKQLRQIPTRRRRRGRSQSSTASGPRGRACSSTASMTASRFSSPAHYCSNPRVRLSLFFIMPCSRKYMSLSALPPRHCPRRLRRSTRARQRETSNQEQEPDGGKARVRPRRRQGEWHHRPREDEKEKDQRALGP